MSNPPLNTIYGTSEPKQDGKLTGLVDVAGVEHLAYPTARRTLCLERFADQCSPTQTGDEHLPDLHPRSQPDEARPQQRRDDTTAARRNRAGETLAAAAFVALVPRHPRSAAR